MDDLDDEQRHRLSVLKRLKRRQLTNADAARILRLSARQVRRLKRAYSRRGEAALVHGNTGRAPANRTRERVRMEVLKLRRTKYLGFNDHHFADELVEAEHIRLSVPTGIELQKGCAFRYRGVVGNDNAVRLSGNVIDIPPGPGRRSYAKAQVEIRQFLDGSWRVYLREQLIAQAPPSALEELRPLKQHKHSAAVRAFGKGVRRMRT